MLWAADSGGLEIRESGDGSRRLRATFPYGRDAVLSEGGRNGPRRIERFAPHAFADSLAAGDDIHMLVGHSFDRPLASRQAGTMTMRDTAEALEIEATLTGDMAGVSYVRDFLAAHASGLVRGLSPGFAIAAVEGAETIEERGRAIVRTIHHARLVEVSAVTRPAYSDAQIEARNWQASAEPPDAGLRRALQRWRA